MLRSWALCALACSAAALSSTRVEHATLNYVRRLQELDSPFGFSEPPKCNRCGKDGPQDYNCCHPGGAWAGVCGDEGMIARGVANYTYAQGFVVCQERLKRFKNFDPFYRPWRHKNSKRPSKFEARAPRSPGALRSTPSIPSAASVCLIRVHSTCSGFPGAAGVLSYNRPGSSLIVFSFHSVPPTCSFIHHFHIICVISQRGAGSTLRGQAG